MKGQNLRICEVSKQHRVQGETSCELHISIETESEINKDNADEWDYPAFMGYSFDTTIEVQISTFKKKDESVMRATDFNAGDAHALSLAKFIGTTYNSSVCHAFFICTSVSYKADNKKAVTATIKHEGNGELEFDE